LFLPKQLQKLSEDFFIEMERALKTVQNRLPSAIDDIDSARDALIRKFRNGIIKNITHFRMLSKIATSVRKLGVKEAKARQAIKLIFDAGNKTSIEIVYAEQFEMRYDERKVLISVESIYDYLRADILVSDELRTKLTRLKNLIERLLRS
jgi:ParB family chromosome partitioning protein